MLKQARLVLSIFTVILCLSIIAGCSSKSKQTPAQKTNDTVVEENNNESDI